MTNDSMLADAFRPYWCARDHKHVSSAPEEPRSMIDNSVNC